jgi:hypothetical protein
MSRSPRGAVVPAGLFQRLQSARPRDLPRAKGRSEPRVLQRMNKGEAAYASVLEERRAAGHVVAWWFELLSLRLADSTHYRPDFLVMLADGSLELHEVKGRKGDSFYATEDSWPKIKIAAEVSPFPIRVVWPRRGGGWDELAL